MNPIKLIRPYISRHESEILMGMGLAGLLFSTVWGIKATTKAVKIIEKMTTPEKKLSAKEIVKATWRLYLPVVISTAVSVPCIIMGNNVSSKKYAALATAYTLSETAMQEYRDKAKEIIGPKKESSIQDSSIQKIVNENPASDSKIFITGDGDTLFYEQITGRYFKSSWNRILKSANELNARAMSNTCGYITLNDWFDELGLPSTVIGDNIGWGVAKQGTKGLINIEMGTVVAKDDIPCGAINYNNLPINIQDLW